jgi:hypothetical protein
MPGMSSSTTRPFPTPVTGLREAGSEPLYQYTDSFTNLDLINDIGSYFDASNEDFSGDFSLLFSEQIETATTNGLTQSAPVLSPDVPRNGPPIFPNSAYLMPTMTAFRSGDVGKHN